MGFKLKKPVCAYSIYMQEHRPIEKSKNPHLSQAQLMKSVSDDWRSLPAKQKKKYEDEARRETLRYARDTILFKREFKKMFGEEEVTYNVKHYKKKQKRE